MFVEGKNCKHSCLMNVQMINSVVWYSLNDEHSCLLKVQMVHSYLLKVLNGEHNYLLKVYNVNTAEGKNCKHSFFFIKSPHC